MKNIIKSVILLLNTINNVNSYIFYPFEQNIFAKIPYTQINNIPNINNIDANIDTNIDTNIEHATNNDLYEIQIIISKADTNLKKEIGKKIVMDISSIIPKLDIGYDVLHANNKFIVKVLSLDEHIVPHELKKDIILLSIKIAQNADNFGSYLFQQYYNLVDNVI